MAEAYKTLTLAQLNEVAVASPIEYLVDGLLQTKTLNLIAGKPKSGKSTLARQLAVALAQGSEFLGRTAIPGEVLYFAAEELGAHVSEHFNQLGLETEGIHTVLGHPGHDFPNRLTETLGTLPKVKMVIIDPMAYFLPGVDLDSYVAVNSAMTDLIKVAGAKDVAILAVHHTKKRQGDEAGDGILGSSAIAASMCTAIYLKGEMGGIRNIRSSQRYGNRLEDTDLEYNSVTRSFSMGEQCALVKEKKARQTREQQIETLSRHIADNPDGVSQNDLRVLMGCGTSSLIGFLDSLEQEGRIIRTGDGKRGNPFLYKEPYIPLNNVEHQPIMI